MALAGPVASALRPGACILVTKDSANLAAVAQR